MRRRWQLAALALVLLGGGAGGWAWWRARQTAPAAPKVEAPAELASGAEVMLEGQVRALHVVTVAAPLDGILEEIPVAPGDEVFEGQILGRIANETLEQNEKSAAAELEQAKAKLAGLESTLLAARLEESRASADAARARGEFQRAERDYQRQRILLREGATARNTHDTAQKIFETSQVEAETLTTLTRAIQERIQLAAREIEVARKVVAEEEQQMEMAREELSAAQILSPVDGVVVAIRKTAGAEVVKEKDQLFDIGVDLTALEIVLEPPPPVLKRVAAGVEVSVELPELPGGIPGKVRAVEEGKVYVEFASPSPLVRPGANGVVRLKIP